MPFSVYCPNPQCRQALSLPDVIPGPTAACPFCGQVFSTPSQNYWTVPTQPQFERATPPAPQSALPTEMDATVQGSMVPGGMLRRPVTSPVPQRPHGTAPTGPLHGAAANHLGRFEIVRQLGTGSYGAVFQAFDPVLQREVALKVPHERFHAGTDTAARLFNEPKAAAQLRHPHIVPIYDVGFDGERLFIASAFVAGKTLEQTMRAKRLDLVRIVDIVRKLAEALDYAHGQGIVHRDVKPANVMIDDKGEPHLMDFGLAQWEKSEDHFRKQGALLGTPAYMSPEQAGAPVGDVGPASDQFSLGMVLYELLCGKLPFEGPPISVLYQVREKSPPKPRNLRPDLPRDLEAICLKALERHPGRRYRRCDVLAEDLRRWTVGDPVAARSLSLPERAYRWARKNKLLAGAVCSTFAMLLFALFLSARFAAHQLSATRALENEKQQTLAALDQANSQRQVVEQQRLTAILHQQEAVRQRSEAVRLRETADQQRKLADARFEESEKQRRLADERLASLDKARMQVDEKSAQVVEAQNTSSIAQVETDVSYATKLHNQGESAASLLYLARALTKLPPDSTDLEFSIRTKLATVYAAVKRLVAHQTVPFASSVAISPDGKTLAIGTSELPNGRVLFYSFPSGTEKGNPLPVNGPIGRLSYLADGRLATAVMLAPTTAGCTIWELNPRKRVHEFTAEVRDFDCICFLPDGSLFTGLAPLKTGTTPPAADVTEWESMFQNPKDIARIAFSADYKWLLVLDSRNAIQCWEVDLKFPRTSKVPISGPVKGLAVDLAGRRAVLSISGRGNLDDYVEVLDFNSISEFKPRVTFPVAPSRGGQYSQEISISPNGEQVAMALNPSTSREAVCKIYDMNPGLLLRANRKVPPVLGRALQFSEAGNLIFAEIFPTKGNVTTPKHGLIHVTTNTYLQRSFPRTAVDFYNARRRYWLSSDQKTFYDAIPMRSDPMIATPKNPKFVCELRQMDMQSGKGVAVTSLPAQEYLTAAFREDGRRLAVLVRNSAVGNNLGAEIRQWDVQSTSKTSKKLRSVRTEF